MAEEKALAAYCKYCGAKLGDRDIYCPKCSSQVRAHKSDMKKAKRKKAIRPALIGFLAGVLVTLVVTSFVGGDNEPERVSGGATNGTDLSAVESTTEKPDAKDGNITLEESVVFDEDGVRITAKGMKDSFSGIDIELLVENNTDKNIAVSCSDFIVNGITIHGNMYIDAAAGKKSNDAISFYDHDLEVAGIKQIASVASFDAHIADTDTYMKITDISFNISTSAAESYSQSIDESGVILYEQDGISVIGKNFGENFFGDTVTVLVKNDSGNDLIVQADNVSVNGYTISVLHSDAVCDGTVRFCEIDLMKTFLEENGIESIEEVTFELSALDPETFKTIVETGELMISATN